MLRKIRILAGCLFLLAITLLFVGIGAQWWGWAAKLQFLPACLSLNFGVVAALIVLTLLFGRIYCSTICPMGVFQDAVIALRRTIGKTARKITRGKRAPHHFSYRKASRLRVVVLVAFVAALCAGAQCAVALIAPYSAYGRMVSVVVNPTLTLALIGGCTFVVIVLCAWFGGRIWCNAVCPVGSILGLLSSASLFKVRFDAGKCTSCGRCERGCKSMCIDSRNHKIDYSRCVDCFDCLGRCKENALSFSLKPGSEAPDKGRRNFLAASAAIIGTSAVAKAVETDGGLAVLLPKQEPERKGRLVPFGAKGEDNFYSHCTACQLCVSSCPNKVLKPSSDLEHLAQPKMSYTDGFCRPECTICSNVCPAGAILPVKTREEKFNVRIGTARINEELCVVRTKGDKCGNCAAHCPAGAIRMVREEGLANPVPAVIETRCIGCGECEYLCPARPVSAIVVDGLEEHQTRTV